MLDSLILRGGKEFKRKGGLKQDEDILVFVSHLGQALLAEFAKLSAHAEHLKGKLPSKREQLQ